jgi:hypothetical protein
MLLKHLREWTVVAPSKRHFLPQLNSPRTDRTPSPTFFWKKVGAFSTTSGRRAEEISRAVARGHGVFRFLFLRAPPTGDPSG